MIEFTIFVLTTEKIKKTLAILNLCVIVDVEQIKKQIIVQTDLKE